MHRSAVCRVQRLDDLTTCKMDHALSNFVKGPNGERLTLADLPDAQVQRWGILTKARIVAAVEGGLITQAGACARYGLSVEEYIIWKQRVIVRAYPHLAWLAAKQFDGA